MLGPAMVAMDKILEAVPPALSVTLKVMLVEATTDVGVPEITPVDALRDRPLGNVPDVIDQV
jgi:hypothetical protein